MTVVSPLMRCAVVAVGALALFPYAATAGDFAADLRAVVDRMHAGGCFPGATVSVRLKSGLDIGFSSGFADLETKTPMPEDARMFSGSVGKMFVAGVALQLVEQGRLDLDAHVSSYLDDEGWYSRLPNANTITVRMLMNHTSGLPRYVLKKSFWQARLEDPDRKFSPTDLLAYVFDDDAVHPAGGGWAYSDTGYLVLGLVIEKITGRAYTTELEERLLKPLGLANTTVSTGRVIDRLPQGYTGDGVAPFYLPGEVVEDGVYVVDPAFEWTGGGVVTSARDLTRWVVAFYEGEVFTLELRRDVLAVVDYETGKPDEAGYGYGIATMARETVLGVAYGHRGIFPGYQTIVEYVPARGCAVAIQVNADRFSNRLTLEMTDMADRLYKVIVEYENN